MDVIECKMYLSWKLPVNQQTHIGQVNQRSPEEHATVSREAEITTCGTEVTIHRGKENKKKKNPISAIEP